MSILNASTLRYKGKIMTINGDLSETSVIAINPDGSMEIVEDYAQKQSHYAGWTAEPYKPGHPRSISLHSCQSDDSQADCILFTVAARFPIDLEELVESGHFSIDDWTVPLYHGHVLWSYTLMVDKREDGRYSLSLASLGSRAGGVKKTGPSNSPPSLGAPPVHRAVLFVEHDDQSKSVLVLPAFESDMDNGHILFPTSLTEAQLREYAEDGHLRVRASIAVKRPYFDLKTIIDLNAKPTVPEGAEDVVAMVLRGESPPDADWKITGSHDCAECNDAHPVPVYAVHKDKFNTTPSGDDGVGALIEGMDDHALRLAIRIAYGVEVPLPGQGEYAKGAIDALMELFGDHFTSVVVPQWERAICRQALALNKSDSSSMVDLLYLLNIIWESPYGLFPVAKRVAIGVMADMAHLNCSSTLDAWTKESVFPHIDASGVEIQNFFGILNSMHKTMASIPDVEKKTVVDGVIQDKMNTMSLDEH